MATYITCVVPQLGLIYTYVPENSIITVQKLLHKLNVCSLYFYVLVFLLLYFNERVNL